MTHPPVPAARRHRRAVGQLLLGLVPVLVVGLVVLGALTLRLDDVQAPLAAATSTATATVTGSGTAPDGRGLTVTFDDDAGTERTGTIELDRALDVPVGAELTVRFDPDDPGGWTVHTDGDAAHAAVGDVLFGLVVVVTVLLAVTALTLGRLVTRPHPRSRPATALPGTHVVVRRGLLVRSWLELDTAAGRRWLPVHWAPEVDRMTPGTQLQVHGDPTRDRHVLPVVGGTEVWPSGRLRSREPRGEVRQAPVVPGAAEVGLARQARADGVLPFLSPVLGLLWAYVDGSGSRGFVVATALAAAVLFWLPQWLGSDPRALGRP